jgi:hypothetical protein
MTSGFLALNWNLGMLELPIKKVKSGIISLPRLVWQRHYGSVLQNCWSQISPLVGQLLFECFRELVFHFKEL